MLLGHVGKCGARQFLKALTCFMCDRLDGLPRRACRPFRPPVRWEPIIGRPLLELKPRAEGLKQSVVVRLAHPLMWRQTLKLLQHLCAHPSALATPPALTAEHAELQDWKSFSQTRNLAPETTSRPRRSNDRLKRCGPTPVDGLGYAGSKRNSEKSALTTLWISLWRRPPTLHPTSRSVVQWREGSQAPFYFRFGLSRLFAMGVEVDFTKVICFYPRSTATLPQALLWPLL